MCSGCRWVEVEHNGEKTMMLVNFGINVDVGEVWKVEELKDDEGFDEVSKMIQSHYRGLPSSNYDLVDFKEFRSSVND